MARITYPDFARNRGLGFWLRPANIVASRRKFLRTDHSIEWRKSHTASIAANDLDYYNDDARYSVPFSALLSHGRSPDSFRFVVMGDTGEGDRSQYALVPLLRELEPDFMLIAGDIVYPAGETGPDRDSDDYLAGLFEPYSQLNIPIWGVPGNHEYYSGDKGRGYFETFCGRQYANRWQNSGLVSVRQPGAFWELRQPGRRNDLVFLGIDTGLHGNLDGHHSWWQFWKKREQEDTQQLGWLHERLEQAQRQNAKVVVMFHIPTLVDQHHRKEAHLRKLHRTLGSFPCVKMVIVGHIHNYQYYPPDVFAHYLLDKYSVRPAGFSPPHYVVCGGGGAYLTSTDFDKRNYRCDCFPTGRTWRNHAGTWRTIVERSGLSRTVAGRLVDLFEDGALHDADLPAYLSLLLVEVTRDADESSVRVVPVFLEHVDRLFDHLPDEQVIRVGDPNTRASRQGTEQCKQEPVIL